MNKDDGDLTDYIHHNEYNWCHKCGMYRIILSLGVVCKKCSHGDIKKAQFEHECSTECFLNVTRIRKKYISKDLMRKIRFREIKEAREKK